MEDLFAGLNPQQIEAVKHVDGPAVVFAGAGSGKTRVIITRIAYLIQQGVAPYQIAAVTFTNKAAKEMKERLIAMSPLGERVLVSTFHSSCARWLRQFAAHLGYTSSFSIYDDKESQAVLKKILAEHSQSKELPSLVQTMKAVIHQAKSMALLPSDLEQIGFLNNRSLPPGALETYRRYQAALSQANAMDFDDLLMNMLLLLKRHEDVRSALTKRYRYILVDEFQDTNQIQFDLISHLAADHKNIFVVGDDDQSIYSWRGAKPSNIIDFGKFFPSCRTIHLEQNYRCSGNIVASAAALIQNNQTRADKTLYTENKPGDRIEYLRESDGDMEAYAVSQMILKRQERFDFSKVAVFYRTNAQSRVLEEMLQQQHIPYRIYGALAFYDRMEIKDIIAYFRLLSNPHDDISLLRVINTPARGIGKKSIEKLQSVALEHGVSLWSALDKPLSELTAAVQKKFKSFQDMIKDLENESQKSLSSCFQKLIEMTNYMAYLEKKFPLNYTDKAENIIELGAALAQYQSRVSNMSIHDWLELVALNKDSEDSEERAGVSLMTLHMAKGLEFDSVYIVGVEDGLLPHKNSLRKPEMIEEERRLLYVGITRAKQNLVMLSAEFRRSFNEIAMNDPSRFLDEIPEECFMGYQGQSEEEVESVEAQEAISVGARVRHPTYGRGVVVSFDHSFGRDKVMVNFFDFGCKKISARQLELF